MLCVFSQDQKQTKIIYPRISSGSLFSGQKTVIEYSKHTPPRGQLPIPGGELREGTHRDTQPTCQHVEFIAVYGCLVDTDDAVGTGMSTSTMIATQIIDRVRVL